MSNTMTAHEPINYLDSILNEEEKRCEYSHQWRNFTISRSGRFKSKNKKRDAVVDAKLFDSAAQKSNDESNNRSNNATAAYNKEQDKVCILFNKKKKWDSFPVIYTCGLVPLTYKR
ncbi:uncharacterized protein LOC119676865 [Teleopsis dalmanni]|uniref:uncharacterized protein LOC119676865 n=1 Tax=Teleopsis dalmanni TaxID=139649 RepID=UPI0018CF6833|nr:uncharacterized protein LOC119676865 [Teleopsis dalmanni]